MFGFPAKLPPDHDSRLRRARVALDGLSVGDGFGECFFFGSRPHFLIAARALPPLPWNYTDDTEMALAILEVLQAHGAVKQEELALAFARRYGRNPYRGYGGEARKILEAIIHGLPWRDASNRAFGGMGSMGNGSAMRVAPLGAYFADDLETAVEQARVSAEVTHAHAEGQAGAIAVAVAAAWAWRVYADPINHSASDLIEVAIEHTPDGETRRGLARALALPADASVTMAVSELGNGSQVTAPDTVPFTLWCAARHLDNYEEALWTTVSGLGDRDTTCAIVGGIVALAVGREAIPEEWLEARETLKV
jgi:ADP-ribosylglycohydrolase